jgi:hypothetical protein
MIKKKEQYLFKDYLDNNTKINNEKLINKFNKLYNTYYNKNKKLKREDKKTEINDLYLFLDDYLKCLVLNLSYDNIKILKKTLKNNKSRKIELNNKELFIYSFLDKYSLCFTMKEKNNIVYIIYNDVKDTLYKLLKDEATINLVKKNDLKISLIKGIIEAYGALNIDELKDFYQKFYPKDDFKEILNLINCNTILNNNFKIQKDKKGKLIVFSKYFKTLDDTKKIFKKKVAKPVYTYDEYISYGSHDFIYNNEYNNLLKLIKHNYVFNSSDLDEFKEIILYPFIVKYKMEDKNSEKELKENIKLRFEYKNDKLEDRIFKQIILVAINEPVWLLWEE